MGTSGHQGSSRDTKDHALSFPALGSAPFPWFGGGTGGTGKEQSRIEGAVLMMLCWAGHASTNGHSLSTSQHDFRGFNEMF